MKSKCTEFDTLANQYPSMSAYPEAHFEMPSEYLNAIIEANTTSLPGFRSIDLVAIINEINEIKNEFEGA